MLQTYGWKQNYCEQILLVLCFIMFAAVGWVDDGSYLRVHGPDVGLTYA